MKNVANTKYKVTHALAVHGKEETRAVVDLLNGHKTIMANKTKEFERCISSLFAKKHGIMVNSGSSANLLAIKILNIPKGAEVITPVLTFSTTVTVLVQNDLIPVFTDVDLLTYQINVDQVEKLITKKTRAIMVPSLLGNLPDLPRLQKIAKKHKLYLIEDSCDTLGATFNGKPTGSYSDVSTTSFYGTHIITGAGNGGMLSVNDDKLARQARILRGWGRTSAVNETNDLDERFSHKLGKIPYDSKYIFEALGYNLLPMEISAAFGLVQLKRLSGFFKARQRNYKHIRTFFARYKHVFSLPHELKGARTVWIVFPLTITGKQPFTRMDIVRYLEEHGVQTRPLFTGNILMHPGFKSIPCRTMRGGYPVADYITEHSFVVGCHHGMSKGQLDYLTSTIARFLTSKGIQPLQ